MKRFFYNNSLSLVLFGLFFITLVALSITGAVHYNEEQQLHGQPGLSYAQYLTSGSFTEAVFENWESEFLQMGAFVVLTIWFKQWGSKDSKKLHGLDDADVLPRYSLLHSPLRHKPKAAYEAAHANSLSIALFALFIFSFLMHAAGGASAYNAEAISHHEQTVGVLQYITTNQFWFESFQNWQSEFLAVGVLIVFTIFLRQRYSPESKRMGEPNRTTGR